MALKELFDLSGKVALITGGSRGLGLQIAEALGEYGATVILTSHYMADVTALAQRILVIDSGQLVFDGDLARLAEQGRGGGKTVKLKLRQAAAAAELARYGHDVRVDGLSAELTVPRAEVSARAARLLAELDVADLTVEDPPIEAVMAELFGAGEKVDAVREGVGG